VERVDRRPDNRRAFDAFRKFVRKPRLSRTIDTVDSDLDYRAIQKSFDL